MSDKLKDSSETSSEDEMTNESSEEQMETDSNAQSSSDESEEETSDQFQLSILQPANITSQQKKLEEYLNNKEHFSSSKSALLVEKSMEPVSSDFTPWWESLDRSRSKKSDDKQTRKNTSESVLYESWFDRASTSTSSGASWLCGPKPKTVNTDVKSQVEDIEVPSIYERVAVSKPKGKRALKKERREEREKTTGGKWFDMKMPEMDSKTKTDMELLQMRRALDPKKFFKPNDRKGLPKYFQLGTVVDEGTDFFSSRLTKKQRKQTLVEELMADADIRKHNKQKYEEIQHKQRFKKSGKKRKA